MTPPLMSITMLAAFLVVALLSRHLGGKLAERQYGLRKPPVDGSDEEGRHAVGEDEEPTQIGDYTFDEHGRILVQVDPRAVAQKHVEESATPETVEGFYRGFEQAYELLKAMQVAVKRGHLAPAFTAIEYEVAEEPGRERAAASSHQDLEETVDRAVHGDPARAVAMHASLQRVLNDMVERGWVQRVVPIPETDAIDEAVRWANRYLNEIREERHQSDS